MCGHDPFPVRRAIEVELRIPPLNRLHAGRAGAGFRYRISTFGGSHEGMNRAGPPGTPGDRM
jgi:hypothetical protein